MTVEEERLNVLTHGVGAVLSLAGLVVLTVAATKNGSAWHVVSFSIFGATLLLLYLASTFYHATRHAKAKRWLQRLDHSSIYLLIAGTYTPFALVALHGTLGWVTFGIIWGLAFTGIILETLAKKRHELLVTSCYLAMGWLSIFTVKPLYEALSTGGISWLIIGGLFYSVGAVIYLLERIPYNHALWHLFVMGGSIAHFIAIIAYVLPVVVG